MGDPQHSFSAGQARLSSSPLDPSSEQSEGVFSMGTMSTALSNFPTSPGYGTPHSTHRMPGTMSNISQQYQQVPQLAGQVGATNISSQYIAPFNSGQSMPAQGYGPQHVSSHRGPPSPMQQQFQHSSLFSSQHPQAQSYMYYSAPFGQISPSQQHFQGRALPNSMVFDRLSELLSRPSAITGEYSKRNGPWNTPEYGSGNANPSQVRRHATVSGPSF